MGRPDRLPMDLNKVKAMGGNPWPFLFLEGKRQCSEDKLWKSGRGSKGPEGERTYGR